MISQTALDVRARARQGLVGAPAASGGLLSFLTMINEDPAAVRSDTITVSGTTLPKVVTINGIAVTVNAGGTIAAITNNIATAINAEPGVRGQVRATSNGVSVVTVTGLTPGLDYTITEADAELALASVTTAADAAAIPFGRAVLDDGPHPDGEPTRLGRLAQNTAFVAQTATLTVTYAAGDTYEVVIRNPATGQILCAISEDADTNDNTTAAAIEAALAAALPANTVNETVLTNVVTLTAEVIGFEFEVTVNVSGGGGGALVLAHTVAASTATSLRRAIAGVSMHSIADEAATVAAEVGQYAAYAGFRALNAGPIWVDRPGVVAKGGAVWVELAPGATAGRFYTTGSATRVQLGSLVWDRDGRTATDNLAVLRVDLA